MGEGCGNKDPTIGIGAQGDAKKILAELQSGFVWCFFIFGRLISQNLHGTTLCRWLVAKPRGFYDESWRFRNQLLPLFLRRRRRGRKTQLQHGNREKSARSRLWAFPDEIATFWLSPLPRHVPFTALCLWHRAKSISLKNWAEGLFWCTSKSCLHHLQVVGEYQHEQTYGIALMQCLSVYYLFLPNTFTSITIFVLCARVADDIRRATKFLFNFRLYRIIKAVFCIIRKYIVF